MGDGRFEELNAVTAAGSWWSGPNDAFGVPIAFQNDGTPPGYTIVDFTADDLRFRYKAAGYPEDYQMRLYAPNTHTNGDQPWRTLLANIFYAPKSSQVEYRLNGGEWKPMEYSRQHDPLARTIFDGPMDHAQPWIRSVEAYHMWEADIDADLPRRRSNRWEVRATLPDGQILERSKVHTPQ